jgi:hypothetical protein
MVRTLEHSCGFHTIPYMVVRTLHACMRICACNMRGHVIYLYMYVRTQSSHSGTCTVAGVVCLESECEHGTRMELNVDLLRIF